MQPADPDFRRDPANQTENPANHGENPASPTLCENPANPTLCENPVNPTLLSETLLQKAFISHSTLLYNAYSPTVDQTLESLLESSKTKEGRLESASKQILLVLLNFTRSILNLRGEPEASNSNYPHSRLFVSLKTLRNLCAGEILNQNSFIQHEGPEIVLLSIKFARLSSSCFDVVRVALQLLGNVALAGEEHQLAVWNQFFPGSFQELVCIQNAEICSILCMIIYTCSNFSHGRLEELCGIRGLPIMSGILKTALAVRIEEDWLQLLLSRVCFEEPYFPLVFSALRSMDISNISADVSCGDGFTSEQAFLLSLLSESLNNQINKQTVSKDFALAIFNILKRASLVVDSLSRENCTLPTGSPAIDVLGCTLTSLRDICACDGPDNLHSQKSPPLANEKSDTDGSTVTDSLISSGLLQFLLGLLCALEPPAIIRKSRAQTRNGVSDLNPDQQHRVEYSGGSTKVCPYKGYRRDIVAVIGNCTFRRKHAQDEIRKHNGILLLMQQCVVDDDNPFLREWGIWALRNLLDENAENQREIAELELQGSTDTPEIAKLGLRVEINQKSRRAKLLNI